MSHPGTSDNIKDRSVVVDIDRQPIPRVMSLATIDNQTSPPPRYTRWGTLPLWLQDALGESCVIRDSIIDITPRAVHASWYLRHGTAGGDVIDFEVNVYVETSVDVEGGFDHAASAIAARDRLASCLTSTARNPVELFVKGTIAIDDHAQYSLQYADHIGIGRFIVVSENRIFDIRGGSSSALLKPLARNLFTSSLVEDQSAPILPVVKRVSLLASTGAEFQSNKAPASNEMVSVGAECKFCVELDSPIVGVGVSLDGANILLKTSSIRQTEEGGSVVILIFITRKIGKHAVDVHFAHSHTLLSVTKRISINVVASKGRTYD